MTSKRYHKLFVALMSAICEDARKAGMFGKGSYGRMIKDVATSDPFKTGVYKSYQEAWDGLIYLREKYGMADTWKVFRDR